ncbi:RIP metalloprotease RseP [Nitrospirota bacterium]
MPVLWWRPDDEEFNVMFADMAVAVPAAIIFLGALIFIHELGHFLCAKFVGVKVERFSIGLGPSLWSRKYGETEYILAAIPFGGYVKMLGENTSLEDAGQDDVEPPTEADLERAFDRQSVWKRASIIVMGPLFNIVLAFIIFSMLFALSGQHTYSPPEITEIQEGSPAEKSGIRAGDMVLSVDGGEVDTWTDMSVALQLAGKRPIDLRIDRDGELIEITVEPEIMIVNTPFADNQEKLVIGVRTTNIITEEIGPIKAMSLGFDETIKQGTLVFKVVGSLVKQLIPAKSIGGPIAIFQMAGKTARQGPMEYLAMMAIISVNLGILNLLPIPVLDGGHLVFMSIEALRRKPLSEKAMINSQKVGIALLLTLMLFATYNDIIRLITG